ncbi:UNVERIFIED_CONTAM: hypothetical protein Sradi_6457500 [Sesamum radiatum]|uniref:DUF4283 domain-containing protein n=1 Tax=Sesamum radiatum TaxID=300843 RepID=A0AAW2K6I5_SESRA
MSKRGRSSTKTSPFCPTILAKVFPARVKVSNVFEYDETGDSKEHLDKLYAKNDWYDLVKSPTIRFSWGFLSGAINVRHVFIKFALEEDYTKLWIKSICIAHLLGTPLQTDISTATLVRPSVLRVCIEINLLESLQTEIGLGLGTEVFIQPVIYERLLKYCGTCKNLEHTEDECYKKLKSRAPVWPVERDDQRASEQADLRDVDERPGASSSGAKGTEVELHDMVLRAGMPDPIHGEAVDGGTEKNIPISQSTSDVCQGVEDVATCSLELVVPEELLSQDGSPGGRPLGDEPGAHSVSLDRGNAVSPSHRIVTKKSNEWTKSLFVIAVDAKCDTVERRALWDDLRAVSVGVSPWIVGDDFNTILSPNERSGGSASSGIAMFDFHDAIVDSALVDAGYVGSPYT